VGWAWWAISAAVMLVRGQGVGAFRAAVAVTVLPLLLFLSLVGLMVWAIMGINAQAAALSIGSAQPLSNALISHAAVNGQNPRHATELLLSQSWLEPDTFLSPVTLTSLADVPVADGTLDTFDAAAPA